MPPIVNPSRDRPTTRSPAPATAARADRRRRLPGPLRLRPAPAAAGRSRPTRKTNYVDHTLTDQTSILRFIEDNWRSAAIGDGSFDAIAGPLNGMFDFNGRPHTQRLILNPITGEVVHRWPQKTSEGNDSGPRAAGGDS